jgi:hypothetical protein
MHLRATADPSTALRFVSHDRGELGFVESHPSDKNKDVARMGHPLVGHRSRHSLRESGPLSDCLFLSRAGAERGANRMSFFRHGRSFRPMGQCWGAEAVPAPRCSSVWMSRNRLFLSGLVSTRARLRFTGWCQYALQGSSR